MTLCGPKDDLRFRVETTYFSLTPPALLIFNECVFAEEALTSASLVTVALNAINHGTELCLTVQITSKVGAGMIEGHASGWRAALANLQKHLNEQ